MKRLRYFDEQFLHAVDFNDAEDYHITMRRQHNRLLHTPGVCEGLVVTAVSATAVSVAPGTAIDASGRDIVLEDPRTVDLGALGPGAGAYIVIAYAEKPTDPSDETGTLDDTRWTEEPTIEGRAAPAPDPNEVLLAVVARAGQNVQGVDNAVRARAGVSEAQTKVNRSGDHITGDLTIDGQLALGGAAVAASLRVTGGPIMPAIGNSPGAGIQFPSDPGGGGGDNAFIRYVAEAGETTKLLIGCENDADDRISFQQSGAERLTIHAGNVGIGTTTPLHRLTVQGNLGATGDVIVGTGGNASLIVRHVNGKTPGADAADGLFLNYDNSQPVYVGGGATSALHVYGHTSIRGNLGATGDVIVGTGGNANLIVRHVNGKTPGADAADGLYLNYDNSQPVYVGGGATSALHVYGDTLIRGNLGATGDVTANQDLAVHGNATVNTAFVGDVGHGPGYAGFCHRDVVGAESYGLLQSNDGRVTLINMRKIPGLGGGAIQFRVNNDMRLSMDEGGNLHITNELQADGALVNVPNGLVRARNFVKIEDPVRESEAVALDGVLERLAKLGAVTYRDARAGRAAADEAVGVRAEELETVFPELVFGTAGGARGVDCSGLATVALQGVRELVARVETLEERVRDIRADGPQE